ncbi:CCA tRNA nucleotidyltransferase [Lysinibacillus sp. BW-2-10]|uniref:CCA tRNA nucleotidyltransferase n=1 Tax=Lysinibacillus sp. BW-2-10 TaxID=2590030 RepID=UPI00117D2F89|nr:CCA tRNA nucleotidyltransferase [Lysinibacillus sp. BW-2-10]TSI09057.1 CCA tRNA nucleotidyltransferase [Lysinibacillus sp. BW-2-10]
MMNSEEWQVAHRVVNRIEEAGFEAVIVGGAVRDYLLGKEVNDIDVATSALPTEVKRIFSATVDVGIEHGTILVLDEGLPIEVTTYRTESTYIDYRRPEQVTFVRNLEKDLQRRDFTINAMAITKDGDIVDSFNGKDDLKNGVIRSVGDASVRFREDALRMLRAIRFSAQLGFTIDESTLKAIKQDSDLIEFIARERIAMEFSKMWKGQNVYQGILALIESQLATYLIGNFQENKNHWEPFRTDRSEVGWAYLCLLNRDEVQDIFDFYRLSNREKTFVRKVLNAYNALLNKWNVMDYFSNDLIVLETAYDFATWQNKEIPFEKTTIKETKEHLTIQSMDQLAINGNHLMEWTDKKRGPWIKVALDAAIVAVLNGYVKNDELTLKEWFMNDFINER